MGISQVYDLLKEKLTATCTVKRGLLAILVFVLVGLPVFTIVYSTLKNTELEQKIKDANDETQKNINNSLRHFIDERIATRIEKIQQMKTKDNSTPNAEHELRQSLQDANDHLNVLIFTVGNLSAVVLRMNSSSEWEMSLLRLNLNATKNKLIRLQTELTQLNYSVHTDMVPFTVEAVNDLRHELNILRNSTTANVSELWKVWSKTNTEIEDVVKLMAQQNDTFHFKMEYHSDTLYAEVKDVENKQRKFHNDTKRILKQLRSQMNETRHGLQRSVDNQIARANKSWHKSLTDSIGFLRSSVAKIDAKVDGIKQEVSKRINNSVNKQKEMKEDFSKAKANFQEKDRKHDVAISGQKSKTDSMQKRIAKLEDERKSDSQTIQDLKDQRKSDSQMIQNLKDRRKSDWQMIQDLKGERKSDSQMIEDLKDKVEKMENGASGLLKTDTRFVFLLVVTAAGLSHILN